MDFLKKFNQGLFLAIFTFVIWGTMPLFYIPLKGVDPMVILAFRAIFGIIFLIIYFAFFSNFNTIKRTVKDKKLLTLLFVSGILLTINWGVFIVVIKKGVILQSVLGVLIAPIITIILGRIFYKERLDKTTIISVIIVCIGVAIRFFEISNIPYYGFIIALAFSFYTIVKKGVKIPAAEGMFIETFFTSVISVIYLAYEAYDNSLNAINMNNMFWFGILGFFTILTLVAFSQAAKNLSSVVIGFLQYITPIIQLIISLILGEKLNTNSIISFCFIWFGLIFYSVMKFKKSKI